MGNSMQVQFLSTAPNKRAPFTGAFLFGMIQLYRQELRDELPVKQGVDNALQGRDERTPIGRRERDRAQRTALCEKSRFAGAICLP